MTIRTYAKHGFFFQLENDLDQNVMYFTPSEKGFLCNIRAKILRKNYSGNGSVKMRVYVENKLVASSYEIPYSSITNGQFYYSWVRFDFNDVPLTTRQYTLSMYQTGTDVMTDASFVAWQLEHNFRINTQSPVTSPFEQGILAAEIYLKKDYYEFD